MIPLGAFSLLDTLKGAVDQRHPAVNIERGCGFKKPAPTCIDPRVGIIVFIQQIVQSQKDRPEKRPHFSFFSQYQAGRDIGSIVGGVFVVDKKITHGLKFQSAKKTFL